MMWADRYVPLKHLIAGTHPLTSHCLDCCPWMLSQCAADGCQNNKTKRSLTDWLPHWPTSSVTKLNTQTFFLCIITHGCTNLNHRWRWNSWCWKISLASKEEVHENCERGADTVLWNSHRLILVNCMLHGVTVMAVAYQVVLQCLKEAIHHQKPGLLIWYVLLLHDNARAHTAYTTKTLLDMWC